MTTPEHYRGVLDEAGIDDESLTVVIVAGAGRLDLATALGVDLERPLTDTELYDELDGDEATAYAVGEVPGGVVALEHTGYADPSLDALCQVSAGGRDAAVVRRNIQVHHRFAWAHDGRIVFDDDQFIFITDRSRMPEELRALFDGVWTDVSGESSVEGSAEVFPTGLAMAEVATGVRISAADLERVSASGYYPAPSLVYPSEDA